MEVAKKILKAGLIVIVAIILAFLLLLGFRVANKNQGNRLDVKNGVSVQYSSPSMGDIETGESFDGDMSGISPQAMPEATAPMRGKMALEAPAVMQDYSVGRKVIRDGYITAKVDNVADAVNDISGIARRLGGEVASTNFYKNTKNVTSGTITVRVPFDRFDTAFAEIKQVATFVAGESISGQDVTAQYVDLNAQLDNKKAEEQSLREILDNTDGKIEDVLAVTQELSRVRGEIEQLEGQIRYLNSQTDMASITANISEDVTVGAATSWRPWQIVKAEFANMIKDLQKLVGAFIVIVIRLTPILVFMILFLLILFWIVRAILRAVFKKKEILQQPTESVKPVEPAKNQKPRTRTIAARRTISRKKVTR